MGRITMQLKPFANEEGTAYESSFTDISEYVTYQGFAPLKQNLDNTELEIGIFRHDNFDIEFDNSNGLFSKPGSPGTLFKYTRSNSILRIIWEINPEPRPLAFHPADSGFCSPLYLIGDFLLQDIPAKGTATKQTVRFKALGYSNLIDRLQVPYASISNGDSLESIIYDCLNQTAFTDLVTLDASNIDLDYNPTIDDKTAGDLENKTVSEAFKVLLKYANAVLYIEKADLDDPASKPTVKVVPRTPEASPSFTFVGPGSYNNIENIIDILDDNGGENKIINFVSVPETSFSDSDSTSITKYGTRKVEISFKPITDQTKNETACSNIVDEFRNPLREMQVVVPMNYETLDLIQLKRVNFDYPIRVIADESGESSLPIFDIAEFGDPFGTEIYDFVIDEETEFKVLGRQVDIIREQIKFYIKEIAAS